MTLLVKHFPLPGEAWEEQYYQPLELRLAEFRTAHENEPAALETIVRFNAEIALYRQNPGSFGYVFYLLQKRSG